MTNPVDDTAKTRYRRYTDFDLESRVSFFRTAPSRPPVSKGPGSGR